MTLYTVHRTEVRIVTRFVYWCVTRLCREYHREFRMAVSPLETGGPIACATCGQTVALVRSERPEVAA